LFTAVFRNIDISYNEHYSIVGLIASCCTFLDIQGKFPFPYDKCSSQECFELYSAV